MFNFEEEELVQASKLMFQEKKFVQGKTNKCVYEICVNTVFGQVPLVYSELEIDRTRLVFLSVN